MARKRYSDEDILRLLRKIELSLASRSERGGRFAAITDTLIETDKLNGIDPQVWLTVVLDRNADHMIARLDEMMPWSHAEP